MRKIAFAAFAVCFVTPAFAADSVTSTVTSVDTKARVLTLADRTLMTVGQDVDLTTVRPGTKVVVFAKLDEDGYSPATAVAPAN
jgi:hypothetical protein